MHDRDTRELEKTLKAIANRRRLMIVRYLKTEKEASVGDIAHEIRLSFRSTSRHLAILSAASILEKEQRSSQVFYRLSPGQKSIVRHLLTIG